MKMPPSDNRIATSTRGRASAGPTVRWMNLQAVLNALSLGNPLNSTELAERISAHPSTVTRLTSVLEDGELIEETTAPAPPPEGSLGRPPKVWRLRTETGYAVGLALTNHIGRGVLVDLTGRVLRRAEVGFSPDLTVATLPDSVHGMVDELTSGIDRERVLGLGAGISGIVEPRTGVIRVSALLPDEGPEADGYPLRDVLQEQLGWPAYVANDANLAALATFRRLVRRGVLEATGSLHYLLAVDSLWGFGSGIVIGGEVYAGSRGAAGETGHPSLRSWQPNWGEAPQRALAGDPKAVRRVVSGLLPVLEHFVALSLTLDTNCVVLGGALAKVGPAAADAFRDAARHALHSGNVGESLSNVVRLDDLWPDTVSLGAADLVLDSLFPVPSVDEPGPLVQQALERQATQAARPQARRGYAASRRGSA